MPSQCLDLDRTDPTALRNHVQECSFARSPFHRLHCLVEALDAFLAPRFVTTLAAAMAIVLIIALLRA